MASPPRLGAVRAAHRAAARRRTVAGRARGGGLQAKTTAARRSVAARARGGRA
jgi:hypothetical protein